MHRYTPKWPEDHSNWAPPHPDEFNYRDALDVIEYASVEPLTTWYTYPWLWHLDESGHPRCWSTGSSICDVRTFAAQPEHVVECRLTNTDAKCPDYWFIIESRQQWRPRGGDVTEADAAAFIELRRSLAEFGITLLDDIVINEKFEWWSLHELTSGTTAWEFTPAVATKDPAPLTRVAFRPGRRSTKPRKPRDT